MVPELPDDLPADLYLDGAWRPATGGGTFAVDDPATGRTLATVADATAEDGAAALSAAHAAQPGWGSASPRERAEVLHTLHDAVVGHTGQLAALMTLEMGKLIEESRGEVRYAADFLRLYAEESVRPRGEYRLSPDGSRQILVTHRPVGPCLLITPWNFPLAMATRKIGPSLAAGCTTILKPAELTPLTALYLARLAHDAGVPAGVLNVVPTSDAAALTEPLVADRRLRKLSFTGSTEVGRTLLAQAAPSVLRTSMELGGNAPFLVFPDADLEAAVEGAMAAKYRNIGEACTAANRFLVHEDVAQEFVRRVTEASEALALGPLVEEAARDKVERLVADAVGQGATLHTGGQVPDGDGGWFYPPTVLSGAGEEAELHRAEIFGPVVSVRTFATEDEAVALANDTDYGLAAYLFTRDLDRALRLTERLECGLIGVNAGVVSDASAPFGGVGQSGLGREGSHEGLLEYLETVYVGIARPS